MAALPPDYDSDPGRSRAFRTGWQEDVHSPVAGRLAREGVRELLDVGCGIGRFAAALGGRVGWIGLDSSPRQLADCAHAPVLRADANRLPCRDAALDAVAMLYMLYHLERPVLAIAEARRVLRAGGLFVACTTSRHNDPELVPDGYPPTSFDAEEAPAIVAEVFGTANVETERWDAPLVRLADRAEIVAYARSHLLPESTAELVDPPITLTKRGCVVWARR
jgi:SAM-dependent methyltransferase